MERLIMRKMIEWKNSKSRKPMILKGARQVGKTWIMKEFARRYFGNYVYFNFDEEEELSSIFEKNKNPQRIIELLSLISGERVVPGESDLGGIY